MTSKLITFLLITIVFGSCQENQDPEIRIPNNNLGGTFERRIGNEPGDVAQVFFSFTENTFQGGSLTNNYPEICNGKYKINGKRIEFENLCSSTANFDPSFILNGRFRIQRTDDEIILIKEIGSGSRKITDIYTLRQMLIQTPGPS